MTSILSVFRWNWKYLKSSCDRLPERCQPIAKYLVNILSKYVIYNCSPPFLGILAVGVWNPKVIVIIETEIETHTFLMATGRQV